MKKLFQNKCIILLAVIMLAFAVLSVFGLGNTKLPSSYYQAGAKSDNGYYSAAVFKINYKEGEKLDKIFINFGGVDFTPMTANVELKVGITRGEDRKFSDISKNAFSNGKIINEIDYMKPGEWLQMQKVSSYTSYEYILIATDNAVKINEIALVGLKDEKPVLLSVESVGSGIKGVALTDEWSKTLSETDKTFFSEEAKRKANKLIDEQNKFDVNKINKDGYDMSGASLFYGQEIFAVEGARNVIHGNGVYAEVTSNPVGLFLLGVGGTIFGFNTFGMRIMPLIFTLVNIFLFYYLGKVLFKKDWWGVLLALFYAVGGYALSYATLGLVDAFMVTFVTASFIFAVKFYQKGISDKHKFKSALNLLLSGLFFGLALAVKSVAIYFAIALGFILVFGLIRQFRAYLSRRTNIDEEDKLIRKALLIKYLKKLGITLGLIVAGFVIIPTLVMMLAFLISANTYANAFGTWNLFTYMSAQFNKGFDYYNTYAPYTAANQLSVWGWAVNYGEEAISANKFIFGNIVVVFINAFAVIYGLFNLVITLIESRKKGLSKETKYTFIIPILFALVTVVATWLTYNATNIKTAGAFYLASTFMNVISVAVLKNAVSEDGGRLFAIKGKEVSATKLIVIIVSSLAVVAFLMAFVGLVGIPATHGVFSWNVLSPSQFLR